MHNTGITLLNQHYKDNKNKVIFHAGLFMKYVPVASSGSFPNCSLGAAPFSQYPVRLANERL